MAFRSTSFFCRLESIPSQGYSVKTDSGGGEGVSGASFPFVGVGVVGVAVFGVEGVSAVAVAAAAVVEVVSLLLVVVVVVVVAPLLAVEVVLLDGVASVSGLVDSFKFRDFSIRSILSIMPCSA